MRFHIIRTQRSVVAAMLLIRVTTLARGCVAEYAVRGANQIPERNEWNLRGLSTLGWRSAALRSREWLLARIRVLAAGSITPNAE